MANAQDIAVAFEALQARLQTLLNGLWAGTQVEFVDTTASTNDDLLQAARTSPLTAPRLLMAAHQSAGRGRQGRPWASRQGDSLTFSIAVPLARADWSGLSLAVGVALADALEQGPARPAEGPQDGTTPPGRGTGPGPGRIGLKWPNDLWILDPAQARGGRKLCGVLIESVAAAHPRVAVVGVGLNVRAQPDEGLASGMACLQELQPGVTAAQALERLAPAVLQAVARFERDGLAAFASGFASRDLLAGRQVSAGELTGIAQGIDASGRLLVHTGDGRIRPVASGEVSVRVKTMSDDAKVAA